MDVREKLVEFVDKARRYAANKCHSFMSCAECDHYGEHDGNCRNTYIAESLIADGVTVQEWISVKDRLPTEEDASNGGYVFAYNTNDKVIIATYQDVIRFSDFVKYWTHLPQPPKGE